MNTKNRIDYLTGLRGIFCLIVVIHHFLISFATNYNIKTIFFNDGNLAVLFFLFLSCYLMAYKHRGGVTDYIFELKRRYIRLCPVVFITICVSGILFFNNCIHTSDAVNFLGLDSDSKLATNYLSSQISSPSQILYEGIIGAYINRPYLNPPFWTMKYEFWGVIVLMAAEDKLYSIKQRDAFFLLGLILSYLFIDIYFTTMILGLWFADYFFNENSRCSIFEFFRPFLMYDKISICLGVLSVLTYVIHTQIGIEPLKPLSIVFFMLACQNLDSIKRFLSHKVFTCIGKYSYEIYAIHWIVNCSLTCWLITILPTNITVSLVLALVFTIIISTVLAVPLHWISTKIYNLYLVGYKGVTISREVK